MRQSFPSRVDVRGVDRLWATAGLAMLCVAVILSCPTLPPGERSEVGSERPLVGCAEGLSIIAVPTQGPVPLLVQFSAIVATPSESNLTWSFGDGATVTGTDGSELSLAHLYSSAGLYTATVYETGPNGSASCSVGITATRGALEAHVALSPSSGEVPFTVHLTGTASNGTETYDEFLWDFGDGGNGAGISLNYTYRLPGSYSVTLRVVDSSGGIAVATARIFALSDPSAPGPVTLGGALEEAGRLPFWVWGVAAAGVTTSAGFGLVRWASGRSGRREPPPGPVRVGPSGLTGPATSLPPAPGLTEETADAPPDPPRAVPSTRPLRVEGPLAIPPETIRLSQRIIAHLGRSGVLEREGTVRPEFTQKGMAQALGVRQGPLSNVLRRLVAAGVLTEELRHVRGAPRRVKAYRLTSEGLALASEMRRGNAPRRGRAGPRSDPGTARTDP